MTGEVVLSGDGMYQEAVKYATELFKEGYAEQVIAEWTQKNYTALTQENVQFVLYKASERIAQQHFRDSANIVSLHVRRYNSDIKELMASKFEDYKAADRRNLRIDALMKVLEVLQAKEKVLQLHTKDVQVKVFNKLNAKVKTKKVLFNLSSLSLEEKIEYLTLITKAKKTNNELHSVVIRPKEEETVDIDHIEVKEEELNINQIQKMNIPVAHKQFDPKPIRVDELTKKIQERLLEKAKKQFADAGASLDHSKGPLITDHRELYQSSEQTSSE